MSCSRVWRSLIFPRILASMRFFANPFATRMAFLIAYALERPWEMMQPPLTPRSGAPPYSE